MALWAIESLSISGGFLADVALRMPAGLICIIGPRGSGKSTLAEAIRLVLGGIPTDAPKARMDLLKANLGGSVLGLVTQPGTERGGFAIRRTYGQTAVITAPDARPVTTIDLDRGTFLPLDAFTSADIEGIAEESLGSKRRNLLDALRATEMRQIHLRLADQRRGLEANADAIKATEREIRDLTEQIEELGDVKSRLEALPPAGKKEGTPEFQTVSRQKHFNSRESTGMTAALQKVKSLGDDLIRSIKRAKSEIGRLAISESSNADLLRSADDAIAELFAKLDQVLATTGAAFSSAEEVLMSVSTQLLAAHAQQELKYLSLQHENQEAAKIFEARTIAEQQAVTLLSLMEKNVAAVRAMERLHNERKSLKAEYLLTRDNISQLREGVAAQLQAEAGGRIRIRVQRNADVLEYQQQLMNALHGSKLKNQEDILRVLATIRPEDLALVCREDDLAEFDTHTNFGKERARRILDALRQNLDPLALEVLPIDDRVLIELNVASGAKEKFKDASELSRGQRCTALLPILLAQRDSPLVIDQPEDNLDNHFIYETVVEAIRRLKPRRQMIFITHNANIPVLGEAELVVVMNSDGQRGFVEKSGTVDECKKEIVDLLEGGEEAFELRRRRYGGRSRN